MRNAAARYQVECRSSFSRPPMPTLQGGNVRREAEEWALDASNAELWDALCHQSEHYRYAALGELADREDPCLAPMVIVKLSKADRVPDRRNTLIRATPCIQVTDDSLRSMLATSLWDHAIHLKNPRNDEEESVLLTAIRRYATLRPQADIGKLVDFLADPDELLPRRHVVLLAIQNAFYAWAPTEAESTGLQAIRARVSMLTRRYLDPSWLDTPHGRAVAQGSYCAAAALGCSDLLELTDQNRALKQTWLTEFTHDKLAQMLERWRSQKEGSGARSIHEAVRQAITKLNQTAA